ncbi:metal-dependent hydrolase [Penaeicola halotolerans]|uniref:metal-dependent hydrolase n=1 Tax=Penaeicola halotolerans TaxID=2793196 RepID=UPI001CF8CF28|nr:metal-dependent hydrolase [Penaeicola halotolerans]
MDSLTQIVLGAAVAEVVAGRKLGNKALLLGAVGGTIPDLDVLSNLFFSEIESLVIHRGFSHSIFFPLLIAPILSWLLVKMGWIKGLDFRTAFSLFFWAIFTHPLLDALTGYGTQLFYPLWDYRVELNTIFIIDPLYTLPMLIALIWVSRLSRESEKRALVNRVGIFIAHSYLLLTILNKLLATAAIEGRLNRIGQMDEVMTMPAPFQNLVWQYIARQGDTYYVGYYGIGEARDKFSPLVIEGNHALLDEWNQADEVRVLKRFSKGYYQVNQEANKLIFNDLRFSTTKGWLDIGDYIFSFELQAKGEEIEVRRRQAFREVSLDDLKKIYDRY